LTEKAGGDKNQVITKLEHALTVLKELKDAGVPVDGFGTQAH
jgi:GH35 family endo-1,4-beta-xylanase